MFRVLGLDPGKVNFAFALLTDTEDILETGFLLSTQSSPPDFHFQEFLIILGTFQPDVIIVERYMFRGASSVDAEPVNLRLGELVSVASLFQIPIISPTPSQWKILAKKLPLLQKIETLRAFGLKSHELDAASLALWFLNVGLSQEISKLEKICQGEETNLMNRAMTLIGRQNLSLLALSKRSITGLTHISKISRKFSQVVYSSWLTSITLRRMGTKEEQEAVLTPFNTLGVSAKIILGLKEIPESLFTEEGSVIPGFLTVLEAGIKDGEKLSVL